MIFVKIGNEEFRWDEVDKSWIARAINERRTARESVCVQVRISCDDVSVRLTTPNCGGGGGNRPPTQDEQEIVDLWNRHGLNKNDFSPGNVLAFLQQVSRLVPCA